MVVKNKQKLLNSIESTESADRLFYFFLFKKILAVLGLRYGTWALKLVSSVIAVQGLSCPTACRSQFLDQGSNPCPAGPLGKFPCWQIKCKLLKRNMSLPNVGILDYVSKRKRAVFTWVGKVSKMSRFFQWIRKQDHDQRVKNREEMWRREANWLSGRVFNCLFPLRFEV